MVTKTYCDICGRQTIPNSVKLFEMSMDVCRECEIVVQRESLDRKYSNDILQLRVEHLNKLKDMVKEDGKEE